jgi:hypothetical protein
MHGQFHQRGSLSPHARGVGDTATTNACGEIVPRPPTCHLPTASNNSDRRRSRMHAESPSPPPDFPTPNGPWRRVRTTAAARFHGAPPVPAISSPVAGWGWIWPSAPAPIMSSASAPSGRCPPVNLSCGCGENVGRVSWRPRPGGDAWRVA